jgi:hypothetical protein
VVPSEADCVTRYLCVMESAEETSNPFGGPFMMMGRVGMGASGMGVNALTVLSGAPRKSQRELDDEALALTIAGVRAKKGQKKRRRR